MTRQEADLAARIPAVLHTRRELGLEGLVRGLDSVIVNTEPVRLLPAVAELLRYTGLSPGTCFKEPAGVTFVLGRGDSPNVLMRARQGGENPFQLVNTAGKTGMLPNTRLETFVFRTSNLAEYVEIQASRGIRFMTPEIVEHPDFSFIQTGPSPFSGNSLGFIEWTGKVGDYCTRGSVPLQDLPNKPASSHLSRIHGLDHAATRVRALERNDAILEFMELTGYSFDFAVYVKSQNSITSVARFPGSDFAMVFTSGLEPLGNDADPGPTEIFIRNYGTRVHHLAFRTDDIEHTVDSLSEDGMEFLVNLVGSREEGLKQTFTVASVNTMLVTEYIHRYEGFDGFFTRSNVEELTRATARQ